MVSKEDHDNARRASLARGRDLQTLRSHTTWHIEFCAILAGEPGITIEEACKRLGRTSSMYLTRRKRDSEFAAKVDMIRAAKNPERWDGTFPQFRKHFFGMDTYYHQHQIVEAIEGAKPMEVTMVLVPPEHGKTTVVTDWINYTLGRDPDHRITVVSEGQGHARKVLGQVARRMTDPSFSQYQASLGPFHVEGRDQVWNRDFLNVWRKSADERDYSLEARGATSAIYGTRVDTLVVDDIQSRRNLSRTAELVNTFRQDFMSRVGKTGRTIIVGTRVEVDDFYIALQDEGVVDRLVQLPATSYEEEPCPLGDDCDVPDIKHLRPLCPEMWPSHQLAKRRRQVGDDVWFRAYQQQPQLAGAATFSAEMLDEAKDDTFRLGERDHAKPVVVGLDPALGGGNALVALAYDHRSIDVLDAQVDYNLARTEDILERIESFAVRYRPTDLAVEIVAFQRSLARDDRLLALGRKYGFRVREHTTGRNKADPVLGVGSMAGSFLRGEVRIPWANDYAQRRMAPLLSELGAWRPTVSAKDLRQDTVMAFWFAWILVMERRGLWNSPTHIKRSSLPWTPTQLPGLSGMRRAV